MGGERRTAGPSAALGMTKWRAALASASVIAGWEEPQGWTQAHNTCQNRFQRESAVCASLTPGTRAVLTLGCKRMHKVRVRSQKPCSTDAGASPMPVSCFRWSARPTAPRKHLSVPPACTRPSLFGGD